MRPISWIIGGVALAFWAGMMGLLVQTNSRDGNAPFSELPPSLVLRQIFKNDVTSDLGIYEGLRRIGSVSITATQAPTQIALDGNVSAADGTGGQRPVNFSLILELDAKDFSPQKASLRLHRRSPELHAVIEADLRKKLVNYEIHSGPVQLAAQGVALSAAGLLASVPGLAMFPLPMLDAAKSFAAPQLQANRASAVIREERLDVFKLRAALGEMQATATLGQLGEVFIVRTSTEYSLLANGLDPEKQLRP